MKEVFVFHSPNTGRFSSGVFSEKAKAEVWIKKYSLTGVLTVYPINLGIYDWAILNGYFKPSKEKEFTSDFISGFSSASQIHYHYEDGDLQ